MVKAPKPENKRRGQDDIAIVGMACLYPGAPDLQSFWQNIVDGADCISDPPDDWNAELYLDPESSANDRVYTTKGGFLGDLARFDPLLHGVMPTSVDGGEPDQFLALEIARRAMVDANALESPLPAERVEVVLGRGTYINRGFSTVVQHGVIVDRVLAVLRALHPETSAEQLDTIKRELKASLPPFNAEMAPALVPNLVTGRIANRLNFQGVNYIVDAACASSHIAIERGMQDLRAGQCDMAVVGGVHASTPAPIFMIFCQLAALSRRGRIRPFDRDADGTLLAEGLGILVLKRLQDAEQAGDRIYALLKAVGTASDGRGLGMLAPRLEGESLALQRAYAQCGIDPRSVGLVEAHGTATTVGDETEVSALKGLFGEHRNGRTPCALGSVKSMIGHCLPAAGSAGVIKAALSLYHKVLPPTLNCENPNPELGLDESPFYISSETRPWIHGAAEPRRAGVNAFGFGGINAHAILEEYTGGGERDRGSFMRRPSEALVLAADSRRQLLATLGDCVADLERGEGSLADAAAALNGSLSEAAWRLAVVAGSKEEAVAKLTRAGERITDEGCRQISDRRGVYFTADPLYRSGGLAFLFPGEGSQYPEMLLELCLHFPVVRAWFDRIDRAFTDHPRGLLPSQAIFPPPAAGKGNGEAGDRTLWRMDIGPEAIFAANQAVFALLSELQITPDAILGHSTGEYSALFAARANRYEDEAKLREDILALNRHYEELASANLVAEGHLVAVAGVELGELNAVIEQREDVFLAMDNCPHQQVICTLSAESRDWAKTELQQRGAILTPLPFNRAYHTPAFQGFCDRLDSFFDRLAIAAPETRLYSCMTAKAVPEDPREVRRLAVDQWAQQVRFRETIERMYDDGVRLFVECGPRNNLTAFVQDSLAGRPGLAVPADVQFQSGIGQLNHLIAQLAVNAVPMNLDALYGQSTVSSAASAETAESRHQPMTLKMGLQPLQLNPLTGQPAPKPRPLAPAPTGARKGNGEALPAEHSGATQQPVPNLGGPNPDESNPHEPLLVWQPAPEDAGPIADQAMAAHDPGQVAVSEDWDEAPEVMAAYLQTMDRFLGQQAEVMEAYMRWERGAEETEEAAPGPAAAATIPTQTLEEAAGAESAPAAAAGDFPLLRQVLEIEPGQRLVARSTFDLSADVYLQDHTIGRQVSTLDPGLPALPVVPLTFSMELMAEAAAALCPGLVVTGMEEVRAYRWIALDSGSVTLEVVAECRPASASSAVFVILRESLGEDGRPRPALVEGTIHLAEQRPAAPPAHEVPFRGERAARWRPEEIYDEIMFHGPRLQAIESMDRWGEDGSEGTFVGLPQDRLFAFTERPLFQSDAISLDAAGQLIGMWTADHLARGFHVFPFRMEGLEIFQPNLAPGQRARCRAYIELLPDNQVRSDIEIITADGRVQSRVSGWWDRRFDLPDRVFQLRRRPAEVCLARPAQDLLAKLGDPADIACMLVDDLPLEFLDSSAEIWLRVLAHQVLSHAERRTWQEMAKGPLRRRVDWLLGRVAAKDAVRVLLRRRGLALCPADIAIERENDGRPSLEAGWQAAWGPLPRLSISHKDGHAIAIAADGERYRGAGVDIERVRELSEDFIETAFTRDERTLLAARGNAASSSAQVIRLWAAKEAAGKAVGLGMPDILDKVQVTADNAGGGAFSVCVRQGDSPEYGAKLEVSTIVDANQLVSALALLD